MKAENWVDTPPPASRGELVAGERVLEWSSVELHVRSLEGVTLHELSEGQIGQVQLSRGARTLPTRWWNRFGWPPRVVETLEISLRLHPEQEPTGSRGGLNAPGVPAELLELNFGMVAPTELLQGLPVLQADSPDSPLVSGLDPAGFIGALVGMGASVVVPGGETKLPTVSAELEPIPFRPPLRMPLALLATVFFPLFFLAFRSGRPAALAAGIAAVGGFFLLRHLLLRGRAQPSSDRTGLLVTRRSPLTVVRRYPLYLFDRLVTGRNAYGGWVALASGEQLLLLQAGLQGSQRDSRVKQISEALNVPLHPDQKTAERPALARLFALLLVALVIAIGGVRLHAEHSGSEDRLLYQWTSGHGDFSDHLLGYLTGSSVTAVNGMALSPDGKWLVSRDNQRTLSWDLETQSLQHDLFVAGSGGLAFVAPEEVVSVGPHGTVAVTSSRTGEVVDRWQNVLDTGEAALARSCGRSLRGFEIAVPVDTGVEVWSSAVNVRRAVGPPSRTVRWTMSCQQLLLTQVNGLVLVDLRNGSTTRYRLKDVADSVLATDDLGHRAAVFIPDEQETVAIIDLTAGRSIPGDDTAGPERDDRDRDGDDRFNGVSREAHVLATSELAGSGPVLLHMTADGERVFAARESRNNSRGVIQVFDGSTGEVQRELEGPIGKVTAMAATSDGKWLYAGFDDGSVRGWKLDR